MNSCLHELRVLKLTCVAELRVLKPTCVAELRVLKLTCVAELRVLKLTCVSEEIRITTQPEKYVTVKEGQQLLVSTEASGFPYPRYMWHRFDPKLDESVATAFTQSTLKINQARYVHFFFY